MKMKRRNSQQLQNNIQYSLLKTNNKISRSYKTPRFNAHEHFEVLDCSDGIRYRCMVCGHTTKPNVSTTTLSQHFYDRHPLVFWLFFK